MILKRKSKNIKFIYMSSSGVGKSWTPFRAYSDPDSADLETKAINNTLYSSRDEYLTVRGFRLY